MMIEVERLKAHLLGKADGWLVMIGASDAAQMNEFEDFTLTLDELISAVTDAAKHNAV